MKRIIEVDNLEVIDDILHDAQYGTLSFALNNTPYSIPINFVHHKNVIYFHGAKKGRKIDAISQNPKACFSVVESYSQLPSYFSTNSGDASPATHLFKSVYLEGAIKIVNEYEHKVEALALLMQKFQKEGNYTPLNDSMYKKIINATAIFKLEVSLATCKIKLGQNFNQERFKRVCEHLQQRGAKKDLLTLSLMQTYAKETNRDFSL